MTLVFKSVPVHPISPPGPLDVREHELELTPKCYVAAGWVAGWIFLVAGALALAFFSAGNGGLFWPVFAQREVLLSFVVGLAVATPAFLVSHRIEVQFLMHMRVLDDRGAIGADFQLSDVQVAPAPAFVPHARTCKSGRTFGA